MADMRALHYVIKIANRKSSVDFYRKVLGMKVLRHEEFEEGCKASCNGPYDGKWSKTMIGYGAEDDHFVLELTYNYGIRDYKQGNGFQGFTINADQVLENAKSHNYSTQSLSEECSSVLDPNGYKFVICSKAADKDLVKKVSLGVSNLQKSEDYWHGLLGMKILEKSENTLTLFYTDGQCVVELVELGEPVDQATAYGRMAFSCPAVQLKEIEKQAREFGQKILTPYVSLDTPGKATVEVVILADPDGHEICFVGNEGFGVLSQIDPNADELLNKAIEADTSDEWFAKKAAKKMNAKR